MRKWRLIMAIIATGCFYADAAKSATFYVRATGDDRNDGATAATAFRTLNQAVRALNHGDSIVLGPGSYEGGALLAERFGCEAAPIRVEGDESGSRTGDKPGPVVIESRAPGKAGIWVHRSSNIVIAGLTFRGAGDGARIEKARGARIERCTFDGLSKAVSISECEDVRIESSVISRGVVGAAIRNTSRVRLAHLTVASCSAGGILITSSALGQIRNCIFAGNATAMLADTASAPTWSSDCNTISGTVGSWGLVPLCRIIYEWNAASGMERHSNYVVPAFVDPDSCDFHVDREVGWGGGLPGAEVGIALEPAVERDRDGRPFRVKNGRVCTGAFDYPDPVSTGEWRRIGVAVPQDGVRQSAAIVRKDGNLIRTLLADAAGVRDLWWDGRDDSGQPVPDGEYDVRVAVHDIRLVDDGALGDNGNPMGTFNCDNPQRVVVYPDGSFAVSTTYDEAGIPVRFFSATGQPLSGSALSGASIWGMALEGADEFIVAGVNRQLWRLAPPGERARMPNGVPAWEILADGKALAKTPDGKRDLPFGGIAVHGARAYVSVPLAAGSVVRVMNLADGSKIADFAIADAGDVEVDESGRIWVISGENVVVADPDGRIIQSVKPGVKPSYLAVGKEEAAVVDSAAGRIAFVNVRDFRTSRVMGRDRSPGQWLAPAADLFKNLRDAAWMPDGQLLICEAGRIRAIFPDRAKESMVLHSNFMDALVPHPRNPEVVYCYSANIFGLDHRTGAWTLLREGPHVVDEKLSLGMCITAGIVDGRPYLLVNSNDAYDPTEEEKKNNSYIPRRYTFLDISDPLSPKFAGCLRTFHPFIYTDVRFDKDGNLCWPEQGGKMRIVVNRYQGRDGKGMLRYSEVGVYGKTAVPLEYRGVAEKDESSRGMFHKGGLAFDLRNNDAYLLACTPAWNKMVPAWGASGTGVGKMSADGRPLWFTVSSGGNYTSISSVFDGRELWIMAAKDFGGQVDVFSSDGLRLATGNWGWGMHWTSGFVDMREGLQAYLRPDGKPGAHVEDDNIGRFGRYRLDGADTLRRTVKTIKWTATAAAAASAPNPHEMAGRTIRRFIGIPRVPELPADGDWAKWEAAGVTPQIVSLPVAGWGRVIPENLLQSFNAGASIGAMAHDGKSLYVYFLTTDDTPHFYSPGDGANMWEYDGIELWLEEEQFGLGFNDQGQPRLYKYRYHNREGKEWAANYPMPKENIWGVKLESVQSHPLGRILASVAGRSLEGKPGYALMARIPFEEIKLVGGIAGRSGGQILPLEGKAGDVMRVGVAFDGIAAWGRSQDFKVYWPIGLMFSDPTTNVPFVFE